MLKGIRKSFHSFVDRIVSKILREPEFISSDSTKASDLMASQEAHSPPPISDSGVPTTAQQNPSPELPTSPFDPPKRIAGMKTRRSGEADRSDQIVNNEMGDTIYTQRNDVVQVVYERYAKFGDKIASAVLSKALLPNGLVMMLAKLELNSIGVAMADHDQIVDWIDENGVDVFCKKMGIRMQAPHEKSK